MELSFLRPVYARPGPWSSVYLDASRNCEGARTALELRWRGLAEQLTSAGADTPTVSALGDVVLGHEPLTGNYGFAAFAADGEVVLTQYLAAPPVKDLAAYSPLPPFIATLGMMSVARGLTLFLTDGRPISGFEAGFQVSEHFHPWTPQQGQSAFAWSFMGALGQRTSLPFGTAVTCPGFRYHPAVIAHAAATLGAMYPGRFWLGLGAGDRFIAFSTGGEWPEVGIRSAMMFEAIEVIGKLFSGKVVKHDGEYFTLESARLYTIPEQPVPIGPEEALKRLFAACAGNTFSVYGHAASPVRT